MRKVCFDNEKYLDLQCENIRERLKKFDNKLYLRFGGKLFEDFHASRVLPGFEINGQIKLLERLKKECEIVFAISAEDIESGKMMENLGISYEMEVVRLMGNFRRRGLLVSGVVITLFKGQPLAMAFKKRLEKQGEKVYIHHFLPSFLQDAEKVVSEEGFGRNDFVKTKRPLVVVCSPEAASGKLAVCLSQLYFEYKKGVKAGYAKFEKFPVWNLPLKHPVNIAFEAATANIGISNMLDYYHLDAYGEVAVSSSKDMAMFVQVRDILKRIGKKEVYKSPTDMKFNNIAFCITDDVLARFSAEQEVIKRYLRSRVDVKKEVVAPAVVEKIKRLMGEVNLSVFDRKCVRSALEKEKKSGQPSVAIELPSGKVVAGRRTMLMCATASMLLNALKTIAKIEDSFELISPQVYEPIIRLKKDLLKEGGGAMSVQDLLLALVISKEINSKAKAAFKHLGVLMGCRAHSTHVLTPNDEEMVRKLGIDLTTGDKSVFDNLDE